MKITLTVGQSKITMDPVSIKLESIMISTEAQAMATLSSPLTTVEGKALLTLTGGLVKIN